eukprot:jgi/Ulvmu1/9113/UM005_0208.1
MLWVDKYRPSQFDEFVVNKDKADSLRKLSAKGDFPHILFYGPPGAGKKTLMKAMLRDFYGVSATKVKVETKPWKIELPSRKIEIELMTLSSNYHVEMNPSDVGSNDRYVIQEIIKDMARNRSIENKKKIKILVLHEVDSLTKDAQHSLRRTMEKYSNVCRLVMMCSTVSKVLDPVRSRCLCIRVPAPKETAVMDVMMNISGKEDLALPEPLAARIVAASGRDMRKALLCLECCKVQQFPFSESQQPRLTDWELYIMEITNDILTEQTPKRLLQVRGKVYELLVNVVPPELIIRQLATELIKKLDDEVKHEVLKWAAFYEHRLQSGAKAVFHIEAFVAKVMAVYKAWAASAFA